MKILVKSDPVFFKKERSGVKNNTVRWLDGKDTVAITNTKTGQLIIRTITDVSVRNNAIIISFKPLVEEAKITPEPMKSGLTEEEVKEIKPKGVVKRKRKKWLTTNQRLEIIKRLKEGEDQKDLAEEYGVSVKTIRRYKPKEVKVKMGTPAWPDRKEIIDYIRSKEHTLEEIQKKFNFTGTSAYYWLAQAGVSRSELPKKPKIEPEEDPEEDFNHSDSFDNV